VGRSNVGKSSLINAVVGRRALAHTSKTPGKTRLVNVFLVDERYYLVDLPGYGFAQASKPDRRRFHELLREYLTTREPLAGVIWLLDVRREPSADDREVAELLAERGIPILAAITKADKLGRGRRGERAREILGAVGMTEEQCVVTSSRTREGIEQLQEAVAGLVA
jgi:GTP-binding protein